MLSFMGPYVLAILVGLYFFLCWRILGRDLRKLLRTSDQRVNDELNITEYIMDCFVPEQKLFVLAEIKILTVKREPHGGVQSRNTP